MPRYVILHHDWPTSHFDLMLEVGLVLKTWRVNRVPIAGEPEQAEAIDDHRLEYLTYEGPISRGRGNVRRVESGEYRDLAIAGSEVSMILENRRVLLKSGTN
ncbi:MAG: hypothetical protein K1X57_07410 [Gemmataceae bacterium]|nr:hypothetical protein [Gemmataceae bacterium]